ncbi:hypothetical protein J4772_22425 [Cohnella sp. LGH]|uniref:hypothetical protein n=1 Tax=Cohnella sp. LGH TaxID=1619153 RepID=UPI001ADD25CD|nr:hypothetical protein [Cohnella sp. LGH]QTH40336.1 hypothetical protein J4772_22425 [Cohnella sp. LGH]
MSKSHTKKRKKEAMQAGLIDPELNRLHWHRKPQTQIVMNKKAEQRRTQCRRKGSREGADFFVAISLLREVAS